MLTAVDISYGPSKIVQKVKSVLKMLQADLSDLKKFAFGPLLNNRGVSGLETSEIFSQTVAVSRLWIHSDRL